MILVREIQLMLFRHGTVRGQVSLLSILLTERLTKL